MRYPEEFIAPMREELTLIGVEELRSAEAVDEAVKNTPGTLMIVVNSICGCAAGRSALGVAFFFGHRALEVRHLFALHLVHAQIEHHLLDRAIQAVVFGPRLAAAQCG